MYGQNLGVRLDAPGEPIFTKFSCRFLCRMCFLVLSFRKIGRKMWELWGVEISPLPLKRHIAYTAQAVIKEHDQPVKWSLPLPVLPLSLEGNRWRRMEWSTGLYATAPEPLGFTKRAP